MKILSLRGRGMGVYAGDFSLPIAELNGAALVALHGPNGTGKTTMAEFVPGVAYRETPSRGPITKLANRKDSFLEMEAETTKRFTMRLLMDGVAKTPRVEGVITPDIATSGKVRDYDLEAAKLMPPMALFMASGFMAQGGKGRFLDLSAADRRAMFADMLQLSHLQEISDKAGSRLANTETAIATLRGKIEALRAQVGPVGDMDEAQKAHEDAVANTVEATRAETAARTAHATASTALALAEQAMLAAEQEHRKDAETKRQAEALVDSLTLHIAKLQSKLSDKANLELLAMEMSDIQAEIDRLEAQVTKDMDAERAEAKADQDWQVKLSKLEKTGTTLKHSVEILEQWVARAEKARANVADVPCGAGEKFSACKFLRDTVEMRQEYPGKLAELEAMRTSLAGARTSYAAHKQALPVKAVRTSYQEKLVNARRRRNDAHDAEKTLAGMVEVGVELTTRAAELETANAALAGLTVMDVRPEAQKRHGEARRACDFAEKSASEAMVRKTVALHDEQVAHAVVARLEEQAKAAEKAAAGMKYAEKQLTEALADKDDWAELQRAFGVKGIQALEIDAVGPEVSGMTNQLLTACYGSRWSVALETTALKADGKTSKETFGLRVIDSEHGLDLNAEDLSGGERVIVSEALSLALAIFNCQRSNIPIMELWRDETAGALDGENAVRYVGLLRKALELGHFSRIYFVAHNPELWALADARVVFGDGGCRVE